MRIFIDESGTFTGAGLGTRPSVVGAAIIPDEIYGSFVRAWTEVRKRLPQENGEVKGRRLAEPDARMVCAFVRAAPILFEAVIIDPGLHTEEGLELHRQRQAETFTNNLGRYHYEEFREQLRALRRSLEGFPLQLYLQSVAMTSLCDRVVKHSTLYFAQRRPLELGIFNWTIDAKDIPGVVTPWEAWWSTTIAAMLQSRSWRDPMPFLEGGDYRAFQRFEIERPGWVPDAVMAPREVGYDIGQIMREHFRFSGEIEPGLELVDVLTTMMRRALVGNLQIDGWRGLPSTMIHRREQYPTVIALEDGFPQATPYDRNLRHFMRGGRSMVLKERPRHPQQGWAALRQPPVR